MVDVLTMGEVEARDFHASAEHLREHRNLTTNWTKSANDLRLEVVLAVVVNGSRVVEDVRRRKPTLRHLADASYELMI